MRNLLIILFLLASLTSNATIYYVSAAGSDAANGTSTGTAWQTLSKVNGFTFAAGDQILFRRGDTWVGGLTVSTSGASGNHIVYGAYGSGNKPIITRRIPLTGWSTSGNWTNTSGNIWQIALDVPYWPRIWINGTEYGRAQTSGGVNSTLRYFYNTTTNILYVYATSNPASAYSLIEFPGTAIGYDMALVVENKNYITIQNLDLQGGQQSVYLGDTHHVTIEDCTIGLYCARSGIHAEPADDIIIRRCLIDSGDRILDTWNYDIPGPGLGNGIYVKGNSDRWKIYQNTIKDFAHVNISFIHTGAQTLTDNEIYENYITSIDVDYCAPISFESPAGTANATGNKIYRNYIDGNRGYSILNTPGLIFMYNIVNGTVPPPWDNTGNYAWGIGISGFGGLNASNMTIVNNIISNNAEPGIYFARPTGHTAVTGNVISNNILYNNGNAAQTGKDNLQLYILEQVTIGANTFENNIFYKAGSTVLINNPHSAGADLQTVADFNSSNGNGSFVITGNINADPLFTNGTTDFTLQNLSPAKNAGKDLGSTYQTGVASTSSWPLSVTTLVQDGGWDIGAYVYETIMSAFGDRLYINRKVITQ